MTDFRPLSPDEIPLALAAIDLAFGGDSNTADWDVESAVIDPANTLAAFDPGVVATGGFFDLTMTLPGTVAPVAGVTWVSVAPTHRRRGLLRGLMTRQLTDLHDQGRPLAALWASEGAIYQRFGYGPASWAHGFEVKRGAEFTRAVDVRGLRLETPTAALLAPLYDAVVGTRPGWSARDDAWWDFRLYDPGAPPERGVSTALHRRRHRRLRALLHEAGVERHRPPVDGQRPRARRGDACGRGSPVALPARPRPRRHDQDRQPAGRRRAAAPAR